MPFIVRWPETIKKPKRDDMSVISAADFFPSFCAIAGATLPDGFAFDGKDKSDVLSGKSSDEERTLFWEYGRNNIAYRYPSGNDRSPNLSIREGKWKLLINADGTDIQLYNLEKDSRETTNIYRENAVITERLKTKLLAWRKSLPD